jgi:NTP pyrophosphatase (non-canonical NTP hydrolase)
MRTIADQQFAAADVLTKMVWDENKRQIEKWGVQTRTPAEWMLYLTEEVGELAEAVSECEYRVGLYADVLKEAIHVATLALKIAEMYRME